MTTEGFFDFLRGDRTISVVATEEKEEKAADNIASNEKKNENWILYTLNPESKNCPLNCLIISVTWTGRLEHMKFIYLSY